MNGPTLDQKRARHAFGVVQHVKDDAKADRKQFKVQVKKLPARIITSGLGQALAFLEAKGNAPQLLAGLAGWIKDCGVVGEAPPGDRLLIRVIHGDSDFLRFATAECLAYLQWLVRFTDAEFKDVPDRE
jgi:CRISPR-associated protein Cmr5